jgi:hypothetical protein
MFDVIQKPNYFFFLIVIFKNISHIQNMSARQIAKDLFYLTHGSSPDKIFEIIDTNHSGYASTEEIARILISLNRNLNRHYDLNSVYAFIDMLDKTGDGLVSSFEFQNGFKKILKLV